MKSAITKAIGDAGKPLTANEIAEALGETATAVRMQLRSMAEAKQLKAIEAIGAVARYALPDMVVKAAHALPPPAKGSTPPLSLAELLEDAKSTPARASRAKGLELMPAVNILRQRGMSWKEVVQWLRVRGHQVSACALMAHAKAAKGAAK